MNKSLIIIIFSFFAFASSAQSTESILEGYAKSDEVSKMSLTGDVLRMFAQEYEQREIIDKVDKIEVYIFGEKEKIKDSDLKLIKANLKKNNYEELVNVRDENMKVRILVKEKGDTIRNLFMFFNGGESQTIIAEMKCNLSYDDLKKLELDFEGAEGLKYLGGKKM